MTTTEDGASSASDLAALRLHMVAEHGLYNDEACSTDWPTLVEEHGQQHEVAHSHLHEGQPDYFADYRSWLRDTDEEEPPPGVKYWDDPDNITEADREEARRVALTMPPLLRESNQDAFIGWVQTEAEDHQPEKDGCGCTCGFCAWSIDHVIIMAIREVWEFRGHPSASRDPEASA